MMPILYEAKETNFDHLGLGVLAGTKKCTVKETRNGTFTLDMEYQGPMASALVNDCIIKVDASALQKAQRFRVKKVLRETKKSSIKVTAEHISYKQNDLPMCAQFSSTGTPKEIFNKVQPLLPVFSPFSFKSDIVESKTVEWELSKHKYLRDAISAKDGSLVDIFGGELQFDNLAISLLKQRGMDRGAVIAYGKNLISAKQEENISKTKTSVYGYLKVTKDKVSNYTTVPIVHSEYVNNFAYPRVDVVDFSSSAKTAGELKAAIDDYIVKQGIGLPAISLDVKHIDLSKCLSFSHINEEIIELCDVVTVHIGSLGVHVRSKVIALEWNVLKERIESMTLGDEREDFRGVLNRHATETAEAAKMIAAEAADKTVIDSTTGKTYRWTVVINDGAPSLKLIEVT